MVAVDFDTTVADAFRFFACKKKTDVDNILKQNMEDS